MGKRIVKPLPLCPHTEGETWMDGDVKRCRQCWAVRRTAPPSQPKPHTRLANDVAWIQGLYQRGETIEWIARTLNRSEAFVRFVLE